MLLEDLIKMLQNIKEVHPEVNIVESRTVLGRLSHQIDIRIRDNVVLIQGGHV